MKKPLIILFVITTASYSCRVTAPYQPTVAAKDSLYRDVNTTDTTTIASLKWKEMFTDSCLQHLIAQAIANNLDLKTAFSRVQQAEASYKQSKQAFLPSVSADLSATSNSSNPAVSLNGYNNTQQYKALVTASWEADIWGKLKNTREANLAATLQSIANARAVQTSLVETIANDYYQLLALDQQLKVTLASVDNWQATVDVMQKLKKSDVVTGAAVVQSEASKYATAATVPDLKRSIRELENQINHLLGNPPGPVVRGTLQEQQPITLLATGVPAQLLANRPDVQAAEENFRYYFHLTNVARTNFYPSLTLSASGGYLLNASSFVATLAGDLLQPIFSQGQNKAKLKIAREQQQQAYYNFQNVLISSGEEVSNALYAYQAALDKMKERQNQLINLEKSVDYTRKLVSYGFANYTEVLTAQQSMLAAQLNETNDKLQQLQAIVTLYSALGGGWK